MKSLGIDIGSSSIKIVEVQANSKGFFVSRFLEHPLGIAPDHDQEIEILEYLRSVSAQYDPTQTRFVFALSQNRVAMRNKFFPFNDRIKISRSLPFELEEDIPFSSDNAVFDAKIVRYLGAGAEVLACAAPHAHIQNVIDRAKDSAMDPYLISCEGTAYANPFEDWEVSPPVASNVFGDQNASGLTRHFNIQLHLGHTRTLVCVFEGRSLIHVGSISWGGKNIAQAIATKYEIPYLDAVKELQTKGFILTNKQGATFDQVTFSETISNSVKEMCRDLQLQILEITSEYNGKINSIGLTGGVSMIKNLAPFLTQTLDIPANRISPLEQIPNVTIDRSPVTGSKIGVALGLALEAFKKPKNPPLNFLRGDFAPKDNQLKKIMEDWGRTVKYAAAVFALFWIYGVAKNNIATILADKSEEVLKEQAKSVAQLSGKQASTSGIKKHIQNNRKRTRELSKIATFIEMNSPLDVTKALSESLPNRTSLGMDISSLSIIEDSVEIKGYVKNAAELSVLQKSLSMVATGSKVNPGDSSKLMRIPGKTAFAYSFKVDRNIGKVTK